jgi:hypothetical protein
VERKKIAKVKVKKNKSMLPKRRYEQRAIKRAEKRAKKEETSGGCAVS